MDVLIEYCLLVLSLGVVIGFCYWGLNNVLHLWSHLGVIMWGCHWGLQVGLLSLGIVIGKIIADITFYLPTIIMYEIRKKHLDE